MESASAVNPASAASVVSAARRSLGPVGAFLPAPFASTPPVKP